LSLQQRNLAWVLFDTVADDKSSDVTCVLKNGLKTTRS
jgi:hypothetical protein